MATHTQTAPAAVHAGAHAAYQLGNATLRRYPYEHALVTDLLPPDEYDALLSHLPSDEAYESSPNGRYPLRGRVMLRGAEGDDLHRLTGAQREYWEDFSARVLDPALPHALIDLFCPELAPRLKRDCWLHAFLCRDRGGYSISPHTDTSRKLISAIVYLPPSGDAPDAGTSVCVPVDESDYRFDTPHNDDWDSFRVAWTAPFQANTLFSFLVSERSLHAVCPTREGAVRDTLQLSVMMPESRA